MVTDVDLFFILPFCFYRFIFFFIWTFRLTILSAEQTNNRIIPMY